jgi:hypothetical protein
MSETFKHAGLTVSIEQDQDAQSPSEWGDTSLFLVADHRDFFVPPSPKERNFSVEAVIEDHKKTHWVFLLEAYIHSGVRLALAGEGNFVDRQWDVSLLGAVFASNKEWRLSKKAREAAESLIEEWNQYLSGDVWGYIIKGPDGEDLGEVGDSCWGFYGLSYCIEQAKEAAESCAESLAKLQHETAVAECVP